MFKINVVDPAIIYKQSHFSLSYMTNIQLEIHAFDWLNGTGGKFLLQMGHVAGEESPPGWDYLQS